MNHSVYIVSILKIEETQYNSHIYKYIYGSSTVMIHYKYLSKKSKKFSNILSYWIFVPVLYL